MGRLQCRNNSLEYKYLISEERKLSSDEEIIENHNIKRRTDEAYSGRNNHHEPLVYTGSSENEAATGGENLYNSLNEDVNEIRIQEDDQEMHTDDNDTSNSRVATSKQNLIDGNSNDAYIEMNYSEQDVFVGVDTNVPLFERNASADEISDNYDDNENEDGQQTEREDEREEDEDQDEAVEEGEERPERRPFDLNFMLTPLFEGSNATIGETMFLIETFASRHNLNKVGFQDFLDILNILICPNALPRTINLWDKQFLHIFSTIEYHLYCPNCGKYLLQTERRQKRRQQVMCEKCNKSTPNNLSNGNFFATFNLKKQIKAFLEDPEIYHALRENEQNRTQEERDECIRDLYDGIIYKNLKRLGNILHNSNNLTFNFNLDGASFFTSSDKSCWPIQISINELPFKLRNKKLILAGLWFGPKSPDIETFVKPFCDDMQGLANEGISWTDAEGLTTVSKVIPFCCCVDSVARPKIMNNNQFNGSFGCPWCYNPGQSVVGDANTRAWKYPFLDQLYNERTEIEVRQQMNKAKEDRQIIKGFKGQSVFFIVGIT